MSGVNGEVTEIDLVDAFVRGNPVLAYRALNTDGMHEFRRGSSRSDITTQPVGAIRVDDAERKIMQTWVDRLGNGAVSLARYADAVLDELVTGEDADPAVAEGIAAVNRELAFGPLLGSHFSGEDRAALAQFALTGALGEVVMENLPQAT